jgi:thiol-disulfide isomerase/thioredoxin
MSLFSTEAFSQVRKKTQVRKTKGANIEKTSERKTDSKSRYGKLPTVILINNEGLKETIKPKGKPLLINFWATWCDVCREEFPDLVKIHKDYGTEIDVAVISLDYPVEINRDVPRFLAKVNAQMPAYLLKSEDETAAANLVSEKWQGGLPFTILFDSDGKEIYSYQGRFNTAVLRKKIEELISLKSQQPVKSQ